MASPETCHQLVASASAPGKVILFGDHAVVYGRSAVAASVSDLRVQVDLALTNTNHIVIHFVDLLRDIDGNALKYSISVQDMQTSLGFLAGMWLCNNCLCIHLLFCKIMSHINELYVWSFFFISFFTKQTCIKKPIQQVSKDPWKAVHLQKRLFLR